MSTSQLKQLTATLGFPGGSCGKEPGPPNAGGAWVPSLGQEDSTSPVFFPESYDRGALERHSPQGCKESVMTEVTDRIQHLLGRSQNMHEFVITSETNILHRAAEKELKK